MSLPPIDSVTKFLYEYPMVKEYLQEKEVDLQQIENITLDVKSTPPPMSGVSFITAAFITLTMRDKQTQRFAAVTHEDARKLLTLRRKGEQ
jgi:hypothetical protein